MILNNAIFKRDEFINSRIPKEVKQQFELLAAQKGRSKSEYILSLILKELEQEGIRVEPKLETLKP